MRSLPNHPNHLVLGLTLDSQTQPLLETFHEVLVGDMGRSLSPSTGTSRARSCALQNAGIGALDRCKGTGRKLVRNCRRLRLRRAATLATSLPGSDAGSARLKQDRFTCQNQKNARMFHETRLVERFIVAIHRTAPQLAESAHASSYTQAGGSLSHWQRPVWPAVHAYHAHVPACQYGRPACKRRACVLRARTHFPLLPVHVRNVPWYLRAYELRTEPGFHFPRPNAHSAELATGGRGPDHGKFFCPSGGTGTSAAVGGAYN